MPKNGDMPGYPGGICICGAAAGASGRSGSSRPVPSSATAAMPARDARAPSARAATWGSTLRLTTCAAAASSRLRKLWNADLDADRRRPALATLALGGRLSSSIVVAPPYALTSWTERPSTFSSSPAPLPEPLLPPPPDPDPWRPSPLAHRSIPVCPCLPSPPFPLTLAFFAAAFAWALALAWALAFAAASSFARSSASRCALLSATRLLRCFRPSAPVGASEASSFAFSSRDSGLGPRFPSAPVSVDSFEFPAAPWPLPLPPPAWDAPSFPSIRVIADDPDVRLAWRPSCATCAFRKGLTR